MPNHSGKKNLVQNAFFMNVLKKIKTFAEKGQSVFEHTQKLFSRKCFLIFFLLTIHKICFNTNSEFFSQNYAHTACTYELRVSRGPHDLCLRLSLVKLV